MKDDTKLKFKEKSQEVGAAKQEEKTVQTFEHAEEVLRFDAQQTSPPPAIEKRLEETMKEEISTQTSWWKKLLSKGS